MKRIGHRLSATVSTESVDEVTEPLSESFPFLDFLSSCRRARVFAECFSFLEVDMLVVEQQTLENSRRLSISSKHYTVIL